MLETFRLLRPREPSPLIVEIPHAGVRVPDGLHEGVQVSPWELLRDSDPHVDKLYEGASERGGNLLTALISRSVVDLNRASDDRGGTHGNSGQRGVVWSETLQGKPLLKSPLSAQRFGERIARYYDPYHQSLKAAVESAQHQHGHALLLAAHSMPSGTEHEPRADAVPGTLGGTSAHPSIIELLDRHLRDAGLSVAHDDPYKGGWTTAHYGRPKEGVHAIQLELNRALYMDEFTGRLKSGHFEALREVLLDLVEKLSRWKSPANSEHRR